MMEKKNAPSLKHPAIILLSLFGVGFCPVAPGTAGSLAFLPALYWLGELRPPLPLFFCFFGGLTVLSCYLTQKAQKRFGFKDPSWLVLDEALGMLAGWPLVASNDWFHLLLYFALFRFFDIFKPFPAGLIDRKLKHGSGVILDDIVSGLYAGLCFRGVVELLAFFKFA